jgi:hypothetical protein
LQGWDWGPKLAAKTWGNNLKRVSCEPWVVRKPFYLFTAHQ